MDKSEHNYDEPSERVTDSWERMRERMGAQGLYNALLITYLDNQLPKGSNYRQHDAGRSDVLVWAAMATWDLDERAAVERVAEDLAERRAARDS